MRVERAFNREFFGSHRTVLCGGGDEPLYSPGDVVQPARILYRRDYPASALHEVAHWSIAGHARRRLPDYGYWYLPGPRSAGERAAFFAAEVEAQALEAVFAARCGVRFVVSADDFAAAPAEIERFARAVTERAVIRRDTLPRRAARFAAALTTEFGRDDG
jgi:elongation factor P hydroxylase